MILSLLDASRRHCVDALLLTAYRMAQGPRQKGVRAPDRLVLDLDTLRDSSTFASGQHKNEVKTR